MSVLCLRKSEGCGIPWSLIYIQLWTSVRTAFCLSLQFLLLFCFWALLSTPAYPMLNSLNWSGCLKSNSCLCLSFLNIFGDILFARIFLHIFICLLVLCVNMFILCVHFYFVFYFVDMFMGAHVLWCTCGQRTAHESWFLLTVYVSDLDHQAGQKLPLPQVVSLALFARFLIHL